MRGWNVTRTCVLVCNDARSKMFFHTIMNGFDLDHWWFLVEIRLQRDRNLAIVCATELLQLLPDGTPIGVRGECYLVCNFISNSNRNLYKKLILNAICIILASNFFNRMPDRKRNRLARHRMHLRDAIDDGILVLRKIFRHGNESAVAIVCAHGNHRAIRIINGLDIAIQI